MIKLTFLGDIMCDNTMAKHLNLYYDQKRKRYDFDSVFAHLRDSLKESDYVFGNLETPISKEDDNLTAKMWTFNSPFEFAEAVKNAGVSFVSTANNHCLDAGIEGIESTITSLDAIGIDNCGVQKKNENSFLVAKVKGLAIGVLTYTYGTNAFSNNCYLPWKNRKYVNLLQEQEGRARGLWDRLCKGHLKGLFDRIENIAFPENTGKDVFEKETISLYRKGLIKKDFRKIKRSKPDFLIAYLHIGGQYNRCPSKFTIRYSKWFIKQGCNIVINNHEHVIHGFKVENNTLQAYALGNLLGSAGVVDAPHDRLSDYSIALHVYLSEDNAKIIRKSFSVYKTIMTDEGKYEVWPTYKLINFQKDNEKKIQLRNSALEAARLFTGKKYQEVQDEFCI